MKWVDDAIKAWEAYYAERVRDAAWPAVIPEDVQVGKVLAAYDRDIKQSRRFIQQNAIYHKNGYGGSGYWGRVLTLLDEQHVNHLILSE